MFIGIITINLVDLLQINSNLLFMLLLILFLGHSNLALKYHMNQR